MKWAGAYIFNVNYSVTLSRVFTGILGNVTNCLHDKDGGLLNRLFWCCSLLEGKDVVSVEMELMV